MATCNDCRQRMTCIMAAPDGRWSACDKFEERAKMIIPIKLEKRTEGEREAYAEGYAAGKRDAEKTGKWIDHMYKEFPIGRYECSVCGAKHDMEWNYCPNCGARMVKE